MSEIDREMGKWFHQMGIKIKRKHFWKVHKQFGYLMCARIDGFETSETESTHDLFISETKHRRKIDLERIFFLKKGFSNGAISHDLKTRIVPAVFLYFPIPSVNWPTMEEVISAQIKAKIKIGL